MAVIICFHCGGTSGEVRGGTIFFCHFCKGEEAPKRKSFATRMAQPAEPLDLIVSAMKAVNRRRDTLTLKPLV